MLLFHLVTGCLAGDPVRAAVKAGACVAAPLPGGSLRLQDYRADLPAGKLMGRSRPSVMSRVLGIVIILVLVLLGVWLLTWIGRQIVGLVVGR